MAKHRTIPILRESRKPTNELQISSLAASPQLLLIPIGLMVQIIHFYTLCV